MVFRSGGKVKERERERERERENVNVCMCGGMHACKQRKLMNGSQEPDTGES